MSIFKRKAPPAKPGRVASFLLSGASKATSFMITAGTTRSQMSPALFDQMAVEGYSTNAIVYRCINIIADSCAQIDIKLYKKDAKGKKTEVTDHPILDLLKQPNPAQGGDEFTRTCFTYYLIGGNNYIYGNGIDPMARAPKPPTELQILHPREMKVLPGATLFPQGFEYKPAPDKVFQYPVDQVSGRCAILHQRTVNPLNKWYGLSPMIAGAYGIDINNSGQRWNKRLLDNEARPSGALTVKSPDGKTSQTLDEDSYRRLQEQIEDQFMGADNAGRPLLLEGGLEWIPLSMNNKDMDFQKGKDSSANDIGLIYGVPPQLLGIPGSQKYSNYEQAKLAFWVDTVIPLFKWYLDGYNRWLLPLYGDESLELGYDQDKLDALEPMRKDKSARVQLAEFMTIDEKRNAMGMDDFPHKLGQSLLLTGRGVLLGADGSIVALAINANNTPDQDPLLDGNGAVLPKPAAPNVADPAQSVPNPAKARKYFEFLKSQGVDEIRAKRLSRMLYGNW